MIKHIVIWRLAAEDASARAASTTAIKEALEPLATVIPGIRSLTVHGNAAFPDANWDVVLLSEFDSVEALEGYQVHPEHVRAAAIVREHVTQRASVDVEA
ncbi:hypothetical protein HDC94_000123 [Leifsonia sp. AK011]|uniref:Dabb family protein n=1 Tax=Leifsonia sp. AK011 TaxID=2723075 RepID=UPI0015C8C1A0|nr:Dabb family protein [Leifsonia sp. AK011]NYF08967.1 hypothetical protein [Leifsonia sp. AK011]